MSFHTEKSSEKNFFRTKSESDEVIFSIRDEYELNPLMSVISVVILESCRDEVDVLNSSCRKSVSEKQPVVHVPIEKRYGFSDEVVLERNMQIRLGSIQSDYSRLDRIMTLLKDVLEYGITDLSEKRSYQMLSRAVGDIQEMKSDESKLFSTFNFNYSLNSKLTEEALTDRLEAMEHIKAVDDQIHKTKRRSESFLQEAGIKYTTLLNWEKSRYEQNLLLQRNKEERIKESIEHKKKLMREETKANAEMMKFYVEHMKDIKADIEKWMTKYDEDMDAKDIAILKQKMELEDMQEKLQDLEKKIIRRNDEMNNWIDLRNNRREEKIRNAIQKRAATKIQRWWRNILQERKDALKKKTKKKKKGKK
ncbi:dynein regulatory complex protein 9-like [Coccinella septempunctata]|uniref:dynein regulatory complex protein 9-like n=1 Tax=Coccinella septempunctata TaxID=41139 RepID=UPI001D09435B|nr:dynein regulatory complex protein 9-like [Coccinella septempunctata]